LGFGLLELGVLTDAENYLCLSLDTLNEYPDFTKTWINAPEGGRAKKSPRLSVFSRPSVSTPSPTNHRKQQKARVSNHTSNYQILLNKIGKSITSWSAMSINMATHHKDPAYYAIFTSCQVRIALAQVQHELNHPFRGLVILHGAIEMALSTNGPSPLLAHGLACLGELARSVLENDKLSVTAMSHAKSVADNIYSPPTTAFILRHKAQLLLIKGDLTGAIGICQDANSILAALKDVRAMEYTSLLMGDSYVLQGRLWPALAEYDRIMNSARLRADWRMQLSAFFGQAFVHFIGRNWKAASKTVCLCESLVTDIVAALDSATVITVRSFILLAEISQYKVDMNVLHATIDMVLGIPSEANGNNGLGTNGIDGGEKNEASNGINAGSGSGHSSSNSSSIPNTELEHGGASATDKRSTASDVKTSVEGMFVDAGRAFQYHHRALFVYYAIIMSSLTILESSRYDERREKEKKNVLERSLSGKNADSSKSMSSMSSSSIRFISKKMRKMSSMKIFGRSSANSSAASSPSSKSASPISRAANRADQIEKNEQTSWSSSQEQSFDHSGRSSVASETSGFSSSGFSSSGFSSPDLQNSQDVGHRAGHGFGMSSIQSAGKVNIAPSKLGYEQQSPLDHVQRHLSYGLGSGIPSHGQGLLSPLFDTVATASREVKRLHDRTNMMLKSMKQFVHSSYPVGIGM
jgi:hypothetical protein